MLLEVQTTDALKLCVVLMQAVRIARGSSEACCRKLQEVLLEALSAAARFGLCAA